MAPRTPDCSEYSGTALAPPRVSSTFWHAAFYTLTESTPQYEQIEPFCRITCRFRFSQSGGNSVDGHRLWLKRILTSRVWRVNLQSPRTSSTLEAFI